MLQGSQQPVCIAALLLLRLVSVRNKGNIASGVSDFSSEHPALMPPQSSSTGIKLRSCRSQHLF